MAGVANAIQPRGHGPLEEVDLSPSPSATNSGAPSRAISMTNQVAQRLRIIDTSLSIHLRGWLSERGLAMAGWAIAFLSMIVAIVSLLPGFNSQNLSKKALELAEWTALKDYIEQCKEYLEAGTASPECEDLVKTPLPPPPHVNKDYPYHSRRSMAYQPINASSELALASTRSSQSRVMVMLVVSSILLFMSLLIVSILLITSWKYNYKLHPSTVIQEIGDSDSLDELRTSTHDIYLPSTTIRHSENHSDDQSRAWSDFSKLKITENCAGDAGIQVNHAVSTDVFSRLLEARRAAISSTGPLEQSSPRRRLTRIASGSRMKTSSQNE